MEKHSERELSHDEIDHNSNYPVQSLYYCCLSYLRKNYMLINFTVLSADIGSDMAAIMYDHDHLKKFRMLPYRTIKSINFESYIYKNCFKEMRITTPTNYLNDCVTNGDFHQYIPGILTVGHCHHVIYNPENGNFYTINIYEYEYMDKIFVTDIKHLYPEITFRENSKGLTKIYSEDFFDQYPGLADWAESSGYISKKLWIPENLL